MTDSAGGTKNDGFPQTHEITKTINEFVERRAIHSIRLLSCFLHSISLVLRKKLLLHDLNAFFVFDFPHVFQNQC